MASNLLVIDSTLLAILLVIDSTLLAMASNPSSNGLHPTSDGMASTLLVIGLHPI